MADGNVRVSIDELVAASVEQRQELLTAVFVAAGPEGLAELVGQMLPDAGPAIVCKVCGRPLALSMPRYVHADGGRHHHLVRAVRADGLAAADSAQTAAEGQRLDAVALNAIADVLRNRFGWVPLTVRYGAARLALSKARGAVEPTGGDGRG